MAKTISILNFKGGVAKTTTAASLGTALWIMGKRVLLIDTDIQCNLSTLLGFEQPDENEGDEADKTLHEWLLQDCNPPIYTRYEGLYYIPSKRDKFWVEKLSRLYHNEDVLRDHLNVFKEAFDYILIDCAPTEGLVNTNVMNASDSVLIPVRCDGFSMQGIYTLLESIKETKKRMNPKLEVEGILICEYEKGTKISKKVVPFYQEDFPEYMFNTLIRKNVRFSEVMIDEKTVYESAPDANGAEDYMQLAEELTGEKRPEDWKEKAVLAWLDKNPDDNKAQEVLTALRK